MSPASLPSLDRADLLWWIALLIQSLAIPGTVLPVAPGLTLLPLGALLWCWAVGWAAGWPALALAVVLLLLGWIPQNPSDTAASTTSAVASVEDGWFCYYFCQVSTLLLVVLLLLLLRLRTDAVACFPWPL